jgi:glyoxylase I family protein
VTVPGFLHHIDLTVSDVAAARPLYDLFLRHAGFSPKGHGEDWAGWGLGGRYPCVTILKASGPGASRRHYRYSAGLHHLALAAPDRVSVDALHGKLLALGAVILDAPAAYEAYGASYYAVFFSDPDGLKLEYVYTDWPSEPVRELG